jgi:hypothetical protein
MFSAVLQLLKSHWPWTHGYYEYLEVHEKSQLAFEPQVRKDSPMPLMISFFLSIQSNQFLLASRPVSQSICHLTASVLRTSGALWSARKGRLPEDTDLTVYHDMRPLPPGGPLPLPRSGGTISPGPIGSDMNPIWPPSGSAPKIGPPYTP